LQITSQNIWKWAYLSTFSSFEPLFGIKDPDPHQSYKQDPDPQH
jgi:hypothetical protein